MYKTQEQLNIKVNDNVNVLQDKRSLSNDTIDMYLKYPQNELEIFTWFVLRRTTRNIYDKNDIGSTFQYGNFYPYGSKPIKKDCASQVYLPNKPYLKLLGACIGRNIPNMLREKHKQGFVYIGSFTPQRSINSSLSSFLNEDENTINLIQTSGILKGENYGNDFIEGIKVLCVRSGSCVSPKFNDKNGIINGDIILTINNIKVNTFNDIDIILNKFNTKKSIYEIYRPSEHTLYKFHIDACYANNDPHSRDTLQSSKDNKSILTQLFDSYIKLINTDNRSKPLISNIKLCSLDSQCYNNSEKSCNFWSFGITEELDLS